ncbi:MAG: hypothetical protein ABI181_09335, partial [Mycobacteriaceae bacterium]
EFGNLLTLPIGKAGLIYVEPVYLQRTESAASYPQLVRVLVSFNGRVGYSATLKGALDEVFGSGAGSGVITPPTVGTTPTTEPGAPTTTAPAPTSPPAAGGTTEQAVTQLNAALAAVKGAQTSGDLGQLGQALTKLDAAVQAYQAATGQPVTPTPGATTPPATTAPKPPG